MSQKIKVLVCGGRNFDDWDLFTKEMLRHVLDKYDTENIIIIQGGAKGADFMAKMWAKWIGVSSLEYNAVWSKYGNAAGYIRNKQMLEEGKPDFVIAFPGGKGTANMIQLSKEAKVEVIQIGYNKPD